jgi:hypothetical protein
MPRTDCHCGREIVPCTTCVKSLPCYGYRHADGKHICLSLPGYKLAEPSKLPRD